MKITREQAEAFYATLWPCGHMSHLDNPTRTFLSALVGSVPQGMPYSRTADPYTAAKMDEIAAILSQIADHLAQTAEEAGR